MRRRDLVMLLGLAVLGLGVCGTSRAARPAVPEVVFDKVHPATGVRMKVIRSRSRQGESSEFNLRVQLWDENDELYPSAAPPLHLIVPDHSVSLRKLWWLKTYDAVEGEATVVAIREGLGATSLASPTVPESATRRLGRLLRRDFAEFVRTDEAAGDAEGENGLQTARSLLRAVRLENDFDIYTIPGALFDVDTALGYEYVIPLRVVGGSFAARLVTHGYGWKAPGQTDDSPTQDVPVVIDLQFRVGSGPKAASGSRESARPRSGARTGGQPAQPGSIEAPNIEIAHPGVIVRMQADDPQRKPYLRVDVVLHYAPGATGDAATKLARLAGGEGKSVIMRGLMRDLPSSEKIEADQIFHMDKAAKAIRDVIIEAGFPPPLRVLFSSWVIQG